MVLPRMGLDSNTIGATVTTVVKTARDFGTPLAQVAVHGAPPDGVLDAARRTVAYE